MSGPILYENRGIYIDRECKHIDNLEYFIAMPIFHDVGIKQNDYIRDLDKLIKKHFINVNMDLYKKFSN